MVGKYKERHLYCYNLVAHRNSYYAWRPYILSVCMFRQSLYYEIALLLIFPHFIASFIVDLLILYYLESWNVYDLHELGASGQERNPEL